MQPNKTKLAIQIGTVLLGASYASIVSATSFDALITTIQDVTVSPIQTLDFGENITTAASGVCTMDADAPNPDLLQYKNSTDTAAFTTNSAGTSTDRFGALTGGGCVTGALAQPGIWSVEGGAGLAVKLSFSQQAPDSGDFTFAPDNGCWVKFDGATGSADSDTCEQITSANYTTQTTGALLAAAPATENFGATALTTEAQEGKLYFAMGGTITVGPGGLTQDLDHIIKFGLNVTY
jgi:hypothetical protein